MNISKHWRYLISTIILGVGLYLFLSLPVDSRYLGIVLELVLVIFCFWFGLGIIFERGVYNKLMTAILPVLLTLGYGLFVVLLPSSQISFLIYAAAFGVMIYLIFLVENVFLVAIGYKTVPLYRAAYTVSLILVLLTAFFLFDSMLSFRLPFWGNSLLALFITILLFLYQFWAIAIDLPDDGKGRGRWVYILVAAWIVGQMALVFSFWPVGIFKGSVYLVSIIYLLSGLFQADIKDRLFKGVVTGYILTGIAILTAIIVTNTWG
ncbi:hypothetical protein COS78_00560 [Candidatus Shapirobacteria bacterium CG06_land_8_20_14_3_00_40_12]|uniref:Uncharacterized protein n=2 Tax=Candidatus Shapironibacteriota TaxID=1752721 RepID=A0A2M7TTT8_9BACT|nr:MAG: hypothetical protein COS78_00560 [Candidatus Shapirobacteria bacterium CG06_land_8_20_14_3_00_40_12]PIZ60507.1 MAG: hypothetical protein COY20_01095 [Candidatus Shapirobacteria bacterium CG_4_10_14_0_2_um_filter_40_12]